MQISIIGAGVGGLAAGLRMLSRGHECTIYERQEQIGGRARVYKRGNYIFDAGPTIITAPSLFNELFDLFDEDLHDYVDLLRLDPWYQIRFEDGDVLPFHDSTQEMVREMREIHQSDANRYREYLKKTRDVFNIAFKELGDQPFDNILTMIRVLPDLLKHDAFSSVYGRVDEFFDHEKIKKALSFHPLLIGGNPLTTTSIYRMIHVLEREWGVHYVQGGTHKLIQEIGELFRRNGGKIECNTTIEELIVRNGKVQGLRDDRNQEIPSDAVVSNVDPAHLYAEMLPAHLSGSFNEFRVKQFDYSMGLFVLYFGTDRSYENLQHHEILLTNNYKEVLDDIFRRKKLPDKLNLYLHRPTANDTSLAPPGHEVMYALVPVPNLKGQQDWSELASSFSQKIIDTLERRVCPNLSESITECFHMTPSDFEEDYLSRHGSGFSVQPKLSQSAWFRFHNNSTLNRLYLVGAGTHPGAGLPGVLCSAKTMENTLAGEL